MALTRPLELVAADLAVAPYDLGRRLARGRSSVDRIPVGYLRASEAQRRELLEGLLDAASGIGPTGQVEVTVTHAGLADDVRELALSLGQQATRVSRLTGADGRVRGEARGCGSPVGHQHPPGRLGTGALRAGRQR